LPRNPEHGSIPAMQWLVERLSRSHHVHVFTLYGAPRPECYAMLGASVHHAAGRPLRALASIIGEHRRSPFDVLHNFWLVPGGVVTVVAGWLLRRSVLVHAAGGELVAIPDVAFGHQLYWRGRLWARIALAGADRISAASEPMIEAISQAGYQAERIPLGVDLQRWPPVPPRPRAAGSPARLVHAASLNRVKDQTMLLHAARRLLDQGVAFQLDIAGFDTLNGRMQALAGELGLTDRVRFHGYLAHEQLHALVQAADLFWLSSRHEAGPVAVLEAAVVGVPTAGTAVGHVAEWAPEAAVSVPVADAEGLARETALLLGDENRRMSLAREAQRRALAQDADWTAARFAALYAEVVSGARPRGPAR
jgi:glycosyltransferase involved in cell wall biosynthesis